MAIYSFRDTNTGDEYEIEMPMSERESYLKDNPHIEQIITSAPLIGDAVRLGFVKPAEGFRDILREIKKVNPKGSMNIL